MGGKPEMLTVEGDLRTLPQHLSNMPDGQTGLDGFYAAVLLKRL